MQAIGENIYYEDAFVGVTLGAIIKPRGLILIDAPLRPEDSRIWNEKILQEARARWEASDSENPKEHVLIYLDSHPDRTIGARILENMGHIPTIIAHQETARGFEERPSVFKGQNPDTGAEWELCEDVQTTRWALPDLIFTHKMQLFWSITEDKNSAKAKNDSDEEIILEHHPGPSLGAIWVHVPHQKVLFVGDTVVVNQPPFLESANIPKWLETLEELLASTYEGYVMISGRGNVIKKNDIHTQILILKRIQQWLEQHKNKTPTSTQFEDITSEILSKMEISKDRWSLYTMRMKYGLQYYYNRHFHYDPSMYI